MHSQPSFINRTQCERGCSFRIVYRPPLYSKRDAASPSSIPPDSLDGSYESNNWDSFSLDMEEHACKTLCFDEDEEGCLLDCFQSIVCVFSPSNSTSA